MSLQEFMQPLKQAVIADPAEVLSQLNAGTTFPVSAEFYDTYLDLLPPRYLSGGLFAFGEGEDPFILFWSQQDAYFARALSDVETVAFCKATGARRYL